MFVRVVTRAATSAFDAATHIDISMYNGLSVVDVRDNSIKSDIYDLNRATRTSWHRWPRQRSKYNLTQKASSCCP